VSGDRSARILDATGPAAPPRRNGELVFAAPWQSRIFGLTLALHEAGLFAWDEFRARLIAAIAAWERAHEEADWSYYACWLAALEDLLAARGLCATAEVDARERALAARPAGHDHPQGR
jgi:nitrile hydratase accessory protein